MSFLNLLASGLKLSSGQYSWAKSTTDPIIAWTTLGSTTTQNFAILTNLSSESSTYWQYSLSPFTTWSNFGSTSTYHSVPAGINFNGAVYTGYIESPPWTKGNTQYEQRFVSAYFGTKITTETTAINNFNYNGTLT